MPRIYDTRRWRRLRLHQLSISPLCACGRPAVHVDHIDPITAGGDPWDRGNLQSLCHACHSLKTNADKTGRQWSGVVGRDGLPRGGDHWWAKGGKADDVDGWHFE
jgi:5-methylcytosine-specific restriction enzyme A